MKSSTAPNTEARRCGWCGTDPLYIAYHDSEWGVPSFDDAHLFEMLILEGQQAGLSWLTILKKRAALREALAGFDPQRLARFTAADIERLLDNPGIVRNRAKLQAAVTNARAFLELAAHEGGFAPFLWSFVEGRPVQNRFRRLVDIPTQTTVSRRLARALKQRGFQFVGPTMCYAYMQAVGLVNDHLVSCPRHEEVASLAPDI
ncbi:DNA-3-methyladenine glycosylase I [Thiobacter aerophilum]|uniref:DNA-3-methyladenine glycosylase I n=1 Tax=Thiobacter aerophilum TaxID=3121275 RepID=A0ABV0EHP1_9BURK